MAYETVTACHRPSVQRLMPSNLRNTGTGLHNLGKAKPMLAVMFTSQYTMSAQQCLSTSAPVDSSRRSPYRRLTFYRLKLSVQWKCRAVWGTSSCQQAWWIKRSKVSSQKLRSANHLSPREPSLCVLQEVPGYHTLHGMNPKPRALNRALSNSEPVRIQKWIRGWLKMRQSTGCAEDFNLV